MAQRHRARWLPDRYAANLDTAADAGGLVLASVIEVSSARVAQALAAAGRGIAVVSDDARFDFHELRITAAGQPVVLTLHASWDPRHHAAVELASVASRLAAFCRLRYRVA
jgi:DNA-binding transcriptional LysR family regulator